MQLAHSQLRDNQYLNKKGKEKNEKTDGRLR